MGFRIFRVEARHGLASWGLFWIADIFVAMASSTSPPRGNKVDALPRAAM